MHPWHSKVSVGRMQAQGRLSNWPQWTGCRIEHQPHGVPILNLVLQRCLTLGIRLGYFRLEFGFSAGSWRRGLVWDMAA